MGIGNLKEQQESGSDVEEVSSDEHPTSGAQAASSAPTSVPYANLGAGRMVRLHQSGAEEYAEMKQPHNSNEPFLLYKFKDETTWKRSDIPTLYGTFAAPADALADPPAATAADPTKAKAFKRPGSAMKRPAADDEPDPVFRRPAAAVRKKPARQQKLQPSDIVDTATIKKCGPFKDKSYILDGNKGLVVNVSGKNCPNHWTVCISVFNWLKANPGKTKEEAVEYKNACLKAQDVE